MPDFEGPLVTPDPGQVHTLVLDFDGVFTDNAVWLSADGAEWVRCDRRDGLAFDLLRGFQRRLVFTGEVFIVTRERNGVVSARARKIGVPCHQGVIDKLAFVRDHLTQRFPAATNPETGLVYVGNDLNDIALMRYAGFSVAPSDAHPRVVALADLVLPERGGYSFVRALIERLFHVDQMSVDQIHELLAEGHRV